MPPTGIDNPISEIRNQKSKIESAVGLTAALLDFLQWRIILRAALGLSLAWNVRDFRHLVNFVTPEFFGQMGPATWDYWGPGTEHYGYYWETHVYLGVLPILLAGAATLALTSSVCAQSYAAMDLGPQTFTSITGLPGYNAAQVVLDDLGTEA